jgi:hypothetical protein
MAAKKKSRKRRKFFFIEGSIRNEKTGKMEPYKKKVYWT